MLLARQVRTSLDLASAEDGQVLLKRPLARRSSHDPDMSNPLDEHQKIQFKVAAGKSGICVLHRSKFSQCAVHGQRRVSTYSATTMRYKVFDSLCRYSESN